MPWSSYNGGDRIRIDLTRNEYKMLMIALGFATGQETDPALRVLFLRLSNAVNDGNPNYTPYIVLEDLPLACPVCNEVECECPK